MIYNQTQTTFILIYVKTLRFTLRCTLKKESMIFLIASFQVKIVVNYLKKNECLLRTLNSV